MKELMLAAKADRPTKYPVLVSTKIDGVRAFVRDGVVLSRTFKPIPNPTVQALYGRPEYNGLDGELVVGSPTDPDLCRNTTSAVMRHDGTPLVKWHVFDRIHATDRFEVRYLELKKWFKGAKPKAMVLVPQVLCLNEEAFDHYENSCVENGYEGVIVRDPLAPYKFGRSTKKEGWMLKVKRFEDFEIRVTGYEEQMHNANERKVGRGGRLERSSAKAGKVPAGVLGALLGVDKDGRDVRVGTGFTAAQRKALWEQRETLVGRLATCKKMVHGEHERPRHPVFKLFRDPRDI